MRDCFSGSGRHGRRFMTEHRRHRRHGRFAEGLEGGGMRMGRKLASGDLQLMILALIDQRPRHGYEIIKALEEHSSGFYAPSPGMVYPALTYLEEVGFVAAAAEAAKKSYSLTEAGRAHLATNREQIDRLFEQLARIGQKMKRVRELMERDGAEEGEGAGERPAGAIFEARRDLKAALMAASDGTEADREKIAEILARAAAEIRALTKTGVGT